METVTAGLVASGVEKAVEAGTDLLVQRVPVALSFLLKQVHGKKKAEMLQDAFVKYLRNAAVRYNHVKTLATGTQPRTIVGTGSIYIRIGVKQWKNVDGAMPWFHMPFLSRPGEFKTISTASADVLLDGVSRPGQSRHVLVVGTGGAGKSMLMRYLFLTAVREGNYVPVLLELRHISSLRKGKISILDMIYSAIENLGVELPHEQFEETLRLGKYLFLLDGLDEVKEKYFAETVRAVQMFCAKYPENPCVMTSRPRPDLSPPETFAVVETIPMDADQAADLAHKLWPEDEKTAAFCLQLKNGLYEAHRSFAENPLLLSILFLTFMRNSSIPDHLAEFYDKAYEALYGVHDRYDKGYYRREFRSGLNEVDFKLLFSRFCFQTYFQEQYDFSRDEIIKELKSNILKLGLKGTKPADYLFDLQEAVCLIVEDGRYFKFVHRTLQSYFAAWYTSRLADEKQKELFQRILYDQTPKPDNVDYLEMLCQMESERFAVNALEPRLRELLAEAENSGNTDEYLLERWTGNRWYFINMNDLRNPDDTQKTEHVFFRDTLFLELFWLYIAKLGASEKAETAADYPVGEDHRYRRLRSTNRVPELRRALRKWIDELDEKRTGKMSGKFFDRF